MFYLIFKYRATVSPCIDIVINWDLFFFFFHFTPMEAAWAEPSSCTERVLNQLKKTLKSVEANIIKRLFIKLFFMNYSAAGTLISWLLNKPEIILNLRFLDNIQIKWPMLTLVLLCCLHFYGVLCLTKLFFLYEREREWRKQIHAVEW